MLLNIEVLNLIQCFCLLPIQKAEAAAPSVRLMLVRVVVTVLLSPDEVEHVLILRTLIHLWRGRVYAD